MKATSMLPIIAIVSLIPTLSYADGLSNAAIYTVDRLVCNLYVPQSDVDANIVQGMRDRNLTYPQAISAAVDLSVQLSARIDRDQARGKWCEFRRQK